MLVALAGRLFPGWSPYVALLTIDNARERRFYEIEAAENGWSVRELERRISSSLHGRLALSRNKMAIRRLARPVEKASDVIGNPLVLELPGLEEQSACSEDALEPAIIDGLESSLLEFGKGVSVRGPPEAVRFRQRALP